MSGDRKALDALARAREAARPHVAAQDAIAIEALTTTPELDALADRLEAMHADLLLGGQDIAHRSRVALAGVEDVRRAADLARAAARHGYPRPALEQLGSQAQAIPNARSSDPQTSRDAGTEAHLRPSTSNQLGRLLVAYRRLDLVLVWSGMTSEQAAEAAGISLLSEYAKRCSVLQRLGYLRPAIVRGEVLAVKGSTGRSRMVFEITDDGRTLADEIIAELDA